MLDKFIKKEGKKPWNIFKKDNKNDKNLDDGPKKKPEKLRIHVIYGGLEGGESHR